MLGVDRARYPDWPSSGKGCSGEAEWAAAQAYSRNAANNSTRACGGYPTEPVATASRGGYPTEPIATAGRGNRAPNGTSYTSRAMGRSAFSNSADGGKGSRTSPSSSPRPGNGGADMISGRGYGQTSSAVSPGPASGRARGSAPQGGKASGRIGNLAEAWREHRMGQAAAPQRDGRIQSSPQRGAGYGAAARRGQTSNNRNAWPTAQILDSDTSSSSSSDESDNGGNRNPFASKNGTGQRQLPVEPSSKDDLRCMGCRSAVTGKYVMVEDKYCYHKECFKCVGCRNPIEGSFAKDREKGGYLCSACQPKVVCFGCKRSITGKYTTVEGRTYHKECFTCAKCRHPIDGAYLKSKESDGYLCTACQPKCAVCGDNLTGCTTVKPDGKLMHAGCFKCSDCREVLSGGHFQDGPGRYQCEHCHVNAWQRKEDESENRRLAEERFLKSRDANEFKLRWRPELIPCSRQTLRLMGMDGQLVPRGKLICICLDAKTGQVSCAPAPGHAPQAAVNVSYLATALAVLHKDRREPAFSLDPKDPHDICGAAQVKRFIPSWLARSVVGEVLFQADYELKKICMGETVLPCITDAFSSFDEERSEGDLGAARQWFVVRRAGITISADGALVPYCDMGVEARRLVPSKKGYVDAEHTDPKEPMVQVAALVSRHFKEVAERIPVVAELVAVARAVILARYLMERGCIPDEETLRRLPSPQCPEGDEYAMEIPTLKKKRRAATVCRQGGQLLMQTQERSMHGGVDLGCPDRKVASKEVEQRLLAPNERRAPLPLFMSRATAARAA